MGRKTVDHPFEKILPWNWGKQTRKEQQQTYFQAGRLSDGTNAKKKYKELQNERLLNQLNVRIPPLSVQQKPIIRDTTKQVTSFSLNKQTEWKPKYNTVFDWINDNRNSETIQKITGFIVEQILRTTNLSINNHDLEQLRGFFSLALSEVLSSTFRDQIELYKKVETFVSVAKKVYRVWVYLNDEYDIIWDNNIQLVTNIDDEQLAEFSQRHSQTISKYYGSVSEFRTITPEPSSTKEPTIQLPIVLEFDRLRTESIPLLEKLIGFSLNDHQIVSQALTCSGFAKEYNDVSQEKILDHDGLGTLGDAILKSIISEKLFRQNPAITRGELTDAKRELENNPELQSIGLRLDIDKLLLHRNNELKGKKKLATAIESIVAAIYLSNGFDDTLKFIEKFIL